MVAPIAWIARQTVMPTNELPMAGMRSQPMAIMTMPKMYIHLKPILSTSGPPRMAAIATKRFQVPIVIQVTSPGERLVLLMISPISGAGVIRAMACTATTTINVARMNQRKGLYVPSLTAGVVALCAIVVSLSRAFGPTGTAVRDEIPCGAGSSRVTGWTYFFGLGGRLPPAALPWVRTRQIPCSRLRCSRPCGRC